VWYEFLLGKELWPQVIEVRSVNSELVLTVFSETHLKQHVKQEFDAGKGCVLTGLEILVAAGSEPSGARRVCPRLGDQHLSVVRAECTRCHLVQSLRNILTC
jgi:hypothetical protein